MKISERKDMLIKVLNKFFSENYISYNEFNPFIPLDEPEIIDDINNEFDLDLIVAGKDEIDGITPIQLIQNICEILVGQRLSFVLDNHNRITGVEWYNGYEFKDDFDDDDFDDDEDFD